MTTGGIPLGIRPRVRRQRLRSPRAGRASFRTARRGVRLRCVRRASTLASACAQGSDARPVWASSEPAFVATVARADDDATPPRVPARRPVKAAVSRSGAALRGGLPADGQLSCFGCDSPCAGRYECAQCLEIYRARAVVAARDCACFAAAAWRGGRELRRECRVASQTGSAPSSAARRATRNTGTWRLGVRAP